MSPLKAAVIGCGRIGCAFDDDPARPYPSTHAGAYSENPDTELVALVDGDDEKRERYAARFSVPTSYRDAESMLDKEKPDVVSISTWSDSHAELVSACVRHGVKGIFLEKPLATTLAESRKIASLCAAHDAKLLVNHKRRLSPFHQGVSRFLRSGGLGRLLQANVLYVSGIANTGTHVFDLLRLYFGDAHAVRAWRSPVESPNPTDPNFDGFVEFQDCPSACFQACDTASYYILEIAILGSLGRLVVRTGTSESVRLERSAPSKHASEYNDLFSLSEAPFPDVNPAFLFMKEGVRHLVDCVRRNKNPVSSGDDALKAFELICAFHQSAASDGARLTLPLSQSDFVIPSR